MQFSMQIKHFFCIYPCILGFFYLHIHCFVGFVCPPLRRMAPGISGISGRGRSPFRLFPTNPPLSTARSILLFFSIPPSEV